VDVATSAAAAVAVAAVAIVTSPVDFHGGGRLDESPAFFFLMEEHIEVEGRILTVLAGTMFRVELSNKHMVLATVSGKMRKRFVRLVVGDRVKMEMSPYDLNKARIVWRLG
jgi:translation initiation factor IF-1